MTTDAAASAPTSAQAASGSRYTLLTQFVRVVCKALSVLVVARLVSPADHGVYAMAASVTLFLYLFLDLSLGAAAVQAPSLDAARCSALFRLHLLVGIALTILTVGAAPLASHFYGTPDLTPLLAVLSLGFVFNAAGVLPRALLARQLEFRALNRAETIATLVATAAMLAAAVFGAGAWTFVAFSLVSELLQSLLAWRASARPPRVRPDFAAARPLVRNAWRIARYHLLNYFVQQIDIIVAGRLFGAHALGLYNRASQLLGLPLLHVAGPLSRLALALLSRVPAASPRFVEQSLVSANVIAHLTLPLAALAIAIPEELVRLILGNQWPDAAPVLRWLAVSTALTQITHLGHAICIASDRAQRLTSVALATLPFVIAAVWLGSRHGIAGIAFGLAATQAILAVPRLTWLLHGTGVRTRDFLQALAGPLAIAIALALGATLGRELGSTTSWIWRLVAAATGSLILASLLIVIVRRLQTELRRVVDHLPGRRNAPLNNEA